MLLETAFMPPVSYFAAIAEEFTLSPGRVNSLIPATVYIEASENYQKQSYRNRCRIYAAGGAEPLNVPVVHENGTISIPICRLKIDWSTPWLMKMKRAIVSAYESSPWFDYYKDGLFAILDKHHEHLIDLNTELLAFFLEKTGIRADILFTDTFTSRDDGRYGKDLRGVIHPKRPDGILERLELEKPYWQVFSTKHGFISNLSIMDLLFNEGPDSISWLKKI